VKKLNILIVYLFLIACNDTSNTMQTVPYVDINRFMGDWYVIANIPTFIEKNATNAIESYALNKEGNIETTFTFYKNNPNGEKKVYKPKGYIYNSETNAEWRMQFIWPFKMPFLIIDLADDYSYTVIGYPSKKYLWIMSRKPVIQDDIYLSIIQKLKNINYDINKIQKVPQIWEDLN